MAFGARGANVGLVARGEKGLDAAARDVEAAGGKACVIPTDVADPDRCEAAAETAERTFGPTDVWVNVAFTSVFSPFSEITPAEYRRVTEVSYLGYVYSTMAALRRMKSRNAGTIVQVGSALAYRGIPLQTAYCGAKHAIQGFHEALRCELLHERSKVRVTMVKCRRSIPRNSPGYCRGYPSKHSRYRPSISPRWPREPACTPPTTRGGANIGWPAAQWARWRPMR